jgi:hypothetical protein
VNPRIIGYALLASAFVLGLGANVARAAEAPKDNKGYTASKTTVVELGPEFEGMAGRQLRLRLLTIEPGGYIGLHNHKDRPAVGYFLQGTTLSFATMARRRPSNPVTRIGTTVHWHRNDGTDAAILITADIFKAPAEVEWQRRSIFDEAAPRGGLNFLETETCHASLFLLPAGRRLAAADAIHLGLRFLR